jgi:hypothetical protein
MSSNASIDGIAIEIATSPERVTHALIVRAICFMEGAASLTAEQALDENDFLSTHVVVYAKKEPIGSARIRWFCDFAKIERTAFRPAYRDPRILKASADFVFDHIARKGYRCAITHAEPKYARLWERLLGFKRVQERAAVTTQGHEPYLQLVKQLEPPPNAITLQTHPEIMFRIEGKWDQPGAFEATDDNTIMDYTDAVRGNTAAQESGRIAGG